MDFEMVRVVVVIIITRERGQTKRDKLVLQEWGFCGWVGKPPKEKKSTHKQRRTALDIGGSI